MVEGSKKKQNKRMAENKHVLVVPYPSQGHINPMLQFSKRLLSKGLIRATLAYTLSISPSLAPLSRTPTPIHLHPISDGFDQGGAAAADSVPAYLTRFRHEGSRTLADLIRNLAATDHPVDCVLYDSFIPWVLDVAKSFGLVTAVFFTQPCAVNYVYYRIHRGLLEFPITTPTVSIDGSPELKVEDLPSMVGLPEQYPAYLELVLNQHSNSDEADCLLVNTFYELESEGIDSMSRSLPNPMLAIGPTVPSLYLDNRVENDRDYDLNLFDLNPSTSLDWLSTKAKGSVVYVSFGSMACLGEAQMLELAAAMATVAASSNSSVLWVVRGSEAAKLPKGFTFNGETQGLIVNWSPQLKVLASGAVGCFLTHGGWNSTIEALCLGVPMVVMPQWTDQPMNAKLVEDQWRVGLRVKVEGNGIVGKNEIERCVKEVMGDGDKGREVKENAMKWKELAKKAVDEGGSSDKNIDHFLSVIVDTKENKDEAT